MMSVWDYENHYKIENLLKIRNTYSIVVIEFITTNQSIRVDNVF